MFRFSTEELENHIKKELEKINFTNFKGYYHFFNNNTGNEEGTYIFSENNFYHFVYSERGNETTHKVTDNIFEISYWTISSIVYTLASKWMSKNIKPGENQRKMIFNKSLEIMKSIGENYYKAEKIRISEILKSYPY